MKVRTAVSLFQMCNKMRECCIGKIPRSYDCVSVWKWRAVVLIFFVGMCNIEYWKRNGVGNLLIMNRLVDPEINFLTNVIFLWFRGSWSIQKKKQRSAQFRRKWIPGRAGVYTIHTMWPMIYVYILLYGDLICWKFSWYHKFWKKKEESPLYS